MNILLQLQRGRNVIRWILLGLLSSFHQFCYITWQAFSLVRPICTRPPPSFLLELPEHAYRPQAANDLPRILDLDSARACIELADGKVSDISIRKERFARPCYGLVGESKHLLFCETKSIFGWITNAVFISL